VGVAALTKNLADELAPSGISVICVHPGRTRTEKTAEFVERQAKAQNVTPDEIEG
jgi:NAD(P)-dependent dehydrogenase (short-subunit alcohol dehydrogenase family)